MDPLKSFQFSMDPVTPVPTLGIQSHPNHLHNFKALSEFVFLSYSLVKPLSNPFSETLRRLLAFSYFFFTAVSVELKTSEDFSGFPFWARWHEIAWADCMGRFLNTRNIKR